ncbi:MAG: YcxB family protein [Clostridiales bacterium]|nr:YcxB family protein [Clostridiales bacterium]
MEEQDLYREEKPLVGPSGEGTLPAGAVLQFGADLSREEYVSFNLTAAKTAGMLRYRRLVMVLLGITLLLALSVIAADAAAGMIDSFMITLAIFLLMAGAFLLFGLPAFVVRGAKRTYDQTLLNGYRFYGLVTVYPDRMEKSSGGETARISYNQAAYLETADQLIIMAPGARAIVLPARCLTSEDADQLRRLLTAAIPPLRQRLIRPFEPKAERRLPPPVPVEIAVDWKEEALFRMTVEYTDEEFKRITFDVAFQGFVRMLPLYSGLSLLLSLLFAFSSSAVWWGIAWFVLQMLLFFTFHVLLPLRRVSRVLKGDPERKMKLWLFFSEEGILARAPEEMPAAASAGASRIAWTAVNRALERPDCVEFYAGNRFLRIPKRCIPNLEQLRELVDRHVKSKK